MSLGRHVFCRPFRLKASKDHIWISEDVLNNAMQCFAHDRVPRRHVGLAPGPLEARKRATRRRMMNLAQAEGAAIFDPSVLPGSAAPDYVEWKWQSPKLLTPQGQDEATPLPTWLTEPSRIEADNRPEIGKEKDVRNFENNEDVERQCMEAEGKHPLANPAAWEDFKNCRDVNGLYGWAASHGLDVRRYSRLLFVRLCYSGQPLPVLLQALEDAALGTPGNLNFMLDWQIRERKGEGRLYKRLKSDDISLLQQWMKQQLYLGLKSEEDILVFLRFVSRVSDATNDESLRLKLIASFEGLQLSSVFGFNDLGMETQFSILGCITQGPVTRQLLELGFSFVKDMPHLGLKSKDQKIAAFIGGLVHAHASPRDDEEQEVPSLEVIPTILEAIWALPLDLACSVTLITTKALVKDDLRLPPSEAATMHLPDAWLSALAKERKFRRKIILKTKVESFLGTQKPEVAIPYLQQLDARKQASFIVRYWIGPRSRFGQYRGHLFDDFRLVKRSDLHLIDIFEATRDSAPESSQQSDTHIRRIFKMLQMLHQSETIVQIIKQAGEANALLDESDVLYIIGEHLREQPQLAERMFSSYPELRLEKCPELAERIILDPDSHPHTALRHLWRSCSRFHLHREPRVELLGRMALAYSMALHLTPRMAFRKVYECYTQHEKQRLGPVPVAVARAFTRAGLIRPLQAGQWVNTTQVRWVLAIVRATEGAHVADRVDEVVYRWRGTNVK